jgi:hypothetical protein
MTQLESLITRLREATVPDRELDIEIAMAFWKPGSDYTRIRRPILAEDCDVEEVGISGVHAIKRVAPVTSSLDAAIALVERVLPEANCYGAEKDWKGWLCFVSRNNVKSGHWYKEAEHPTSAPLALLTAAVTALIELERGKHEV